jgi:uncharacterized protein YegL
MKINKFYRTLLVLAMATGMFLMVLPGCKKDKEDEITGPYSNMNDMTTTSIKLTIPRIETSLQRSTLIRLFLSVTDQDGNPLRNFNVYNFEITEVCSGDTDTTLVGSLTINELNDEASYLAAALTMDYSGSMGAEDVMNMEDAVKTFMEKKQQNDYMEVIKFGSKVQVVSPFTDNLDSLNYAVDSIPYNGSGSTAFCDAVNRGLVDGDEFYQTHPDYFPTVLGFTDGHDNLSHISLDKLIDSAKTKQIPVYTIGFGDANTNKMTKLADQTGGRYYYTPDAEELSKLYSLISGQLKNLYIAEWTYDNPACDTVLVTVKVSYTCANGDFVSFARKEFFPVH